MDFVEEILTSRYRFFEKTQGMFGDYFLFSVF